MSDARDRAETRDLIDTGIELGSISCGCSFAIGLIILGSCAGVATVGSPQTKFDLNLFIVAVASIAIVAFVYLLTRKNAKLKAARAQIEELNRRAAAAKPESTDDTGSG